MLGRLLEEGATKRTKKTPGLLYVARFVVNNLGNGQMTPT